MVQSEPLDATPPEAGNRDGLSTAAFVVGLVAALTGVVYFVAVPAGLVGLVLGLLAIRRPDSVRRIALGGIMLSLIGLVVGLGVIAFLVLDDDDVRGEMTVVDGIQSGTGDDTHPPQRDLGRDVDCAVGVDALRASGQVTNHTTEAASYQLIAMWERDGRTIAESTVIIDSVPAGATAPWEVFAVGDNASGTTTCRVIRIDRNPA